MIYTKLNYERSGSIKKTIKTLVCFAHKQPLNSTSISVTAKCVNKPNELLINMYIRDNEIVSKFEKIKCGSCRQT